MLAVGALGTLQIEVDGAVQRLHRKPLELLSVLVARKNQAAPASWLIDQLWAGEAPASAPSALRVYLAKLRTALEPNRGSAPSSRLANTPRGWLLRLDVAELDISSFEAAVGEARVLRAEGQTDRAWSTLQSAMSIWAGEPYPGVDLEAVRGDAERLLRLHRDASDLYADLAIRRGNAGLVLAELIERRKLEPFDENLAVLHARAAYALGRQLDALSILRQLRAVMNDELGLDPGSQVAETEQLILRHDPRLASVPPSPPEEANHRVAGPLGRQRVLASLRAEVATHRVVALEGEAGIGKTTLLSVLVPSDATTARATCAVTAVPLAVVRDLLASLPAPPADRSAWRRFQAALDARVRADVDPGSVSLLAEDLLAGAIGADRFVALIDDAHLLDPASIEVLQRILATQPTFHVLLARRPWPRPTATGGSELSIDSVVSLPPLADGAARQLLARLRAGRTVDVSPATDDAVLRAAGGNPWLIERTLALEEGARAYVADRLMTGLTSDAKQVALILAVVGAAVPVRTLVALGRMETVEELLVGRVAVMVDGQVTLRHDLVAADLIAGAGPIQIAAAAAGLVRRARELGLRPLDLTSAIRRAEPLLDDDAVATWALAAGQEALEAGGLDLAAELFSEASRRAPPGQLLRSSAELGRGRAFAAAGRVSEARTALIAAMETAQPHGDDLLVKEALVGLVGLLAPEEVDAAVVDTVSASLLERGHLSEPDVIEILEARAASASTRGYAIVEARTQELLDRCAAVGTPYAALHSLLGQWRLVYARGDPSTSRLPLSSAAIELAENLQRDVLLARSLRHNIDDLLASGLPDAADEVTSRLQDLGRSRAIAQARWWGDLLDAARTLRTGSSAQGLAEAATVHESWPRMPAVVRDEYLRLQNLVGLYQLGERSALIGALEEAERTILPSNVSPLLPAAKVAVLAERRATCADAEPLFHEVLAQVLNHPPSWWQPASWYLLGRAAVGLGVDGEVIFDHLLPHAGTWMLLGTAAASLGPVDGVLAALASAGGRRQEEQRYFVAAMALAERMDAEHWAEDTRDLLRLAQTGGAVHVQRPRGKAATPRPYG